MCSTFSVKLFYHVQDAFARQVFQRNFRTYPHIIYELVKLKVNGPIRSRDFWWLGFWAIWRGSVAPTHLRITQHIRLALLLSFVTVARNPNEHTTRLAHIRPSK